MIDCAKENKVNQMLIPGTDIISSKRAIEIADNYENIYAAVAIHPHHMFKYQDGVLVNEDLNEIEKLLTNKKVVAIGETGLDKHLYKNTKYKAYSVDESFIKLQISILEKQIKLAIKYNKSLILHNWEAGIELLDLLNKIWDERLEGRTVFHCCEPNEELLNYAKEHRIYIGVDGDVTFNKEKQNFVKKIPLEMLVLETDSPYLLPRLHAFFAGEATKAEQDFGGQAEPLHFPNEPKNLPLIAQFIAKVMNVSINQLIDTTTENAEKLFQLDK